MLTIHSVEEAPQRPRGYVYQLTAELEDFT
jgi:hypothetical protein